MFGRDDEEDIDKAVEQDIEKDEYLDKLLERDFVSSQEVAKALIAAELMKKDNIQRITQINQREVTLLTVVGSVAKKTKSSIRKDFVKNFPEWRISTDGTGWKDFVDIIKPTQPPEPKKGIIGKVFG